MIFNLSSMKDIWKFILNLENIPLGVVMNIDCHALSLSVVQLCDVINLS